RRGRRGGRALRVAGILGGMGQERQDFGGWPTCLNGYRVSAARKHCGRWVGTSDRMADEGGCTPPARTKERPALEPTHRSRRHRCEGLTGRPIGRPGFATIMSYRFCPLWAARAGQVAEWSKAHAWKACIRQKRI